MNPIQDRLRIAVSAALEEARAASKLEHPGLIGLVREIMVEKILRPVLTPEVHIGTGKLVDSKGALSNQLDVILYSPEIMPPGLYDQRTGLFPAESCLYTVEVKSTLNSEALKQSVDGAKKVRQLSFLPTEHHVGTNTQESPIALPICALFAFGSDLTGDEGKEFDRLRELDYASDNDPYINVLCVVGRGYWCRTKDGWLHFPATDDHDEILSYMAGTSNTVPMFLAAKGRPKFGNYLGKGAFKKIPD